MHYYLLKGTGHGNTGSTPIFASASNMQVVMDFVKEKLN